MSATLIIIDMQLAMDDPRYGRRGQPDAENKIAKLLNHWRELGNPIVHIRDDSVDPDSPYAPGKPSHEFKPQVKPLENEPIVEKRTNNAFVGTDLMQVLENIGSAELVICGVHLEHCVDVTLRMAANLGFMVFVPQDCVISVDRTDRNGKNWSAEDVHALTLSIIDGNYAKVLDSSDLISAPENETLQ